MDLEKGPATEIFNKNDVMGPSSQVWLLDSCPESVLTLRAALETRFSVRVFSRFQELCQGLKDAWTVFEAHPRILITEVFLPDGSLMEFNKDPLFLKLNKVVVSENNSPVLIRECLGMGAKDYFVKPFDSNLLLVKTECLVDKLEHAAGFHPQTGLSIDRFSLAVSSPSGNRAKFTVKEFQILSMLIDAFPGPVSRQLLIQALWDKVKVLEKTMDVHLFNVRKKIASLAWEIQYRNGAYTMVKAKEK